jgi:hypothetical protein
MWVPAGLVYAAAALALAGVWIARSAPTRSPQVADAPPGRGWALPILALIGATVLAGGMAS